MAISIDLSGKIALITGASGQLGRVMARTLAQAGADIVVHYHGNAAKAESVAAEVEQMGRRSLVVQADVGDQASVDAMHELIVEKMGDPQIVVANAVTQIFPWKTVLEEEVEDYENQFRCCVMQNVYLSKAFVPAMMEAGWGRYIALNTECTMQMQPTQSAYVSGKRGQDGVLRVLAREVGEKNVTVNQVAPGWTVSERDREAGTEVQEAYDAGVPLRRRGTDQEIAHVVSFLASDLASFITGAYIPVCGGNVMPTV